MTENEGFFSFFDLTTKNSQETQMSLIDAGNTDFCIINIAFFPCSMLNLITMQKSKVCGRQRNGSMQLPNPGELILHN
ncbi:MAG: hypothetical protein JXB88_19480 [Spirochaetales bacterium]|nr:hypothetical protein [Spirochaetales bacterium]